jgi:hypothetical protein
MIKPRSVMMYGVSGSTKTSQCYLLAKMLLTANPGKTIRIIHSDGGGWCPFEDSGMIERGEVEVYDFSTSTLALSDYRKLSQGYWPRKTKEGLEYFKKDAACKTPPEVFANIAAYIIEGMGSCGEKLKTHISSMPEGVGFKEAYSYTEDGETLLGLQQGHYNIVQKEIYAAHMTGFNCLPIPWLIYTSLLGKGEDKKSNETVYGPQVVGNASTPQAPSWFMDCLHLNKEKYQNVKGEEVEGMVAWFQRHDDSQTGVPCLAKARVMPESYPGLLKYFPNGFVPLSYKRGITDYFKVLDSLRKGEKE